MSAAAPAGEADALALDRMAQAEAALIVALDAGEVRGIETAVADFGGALADLRRVGTWCATAENERAVRRALRLLDAAAVRTNFLADQAHRRLDALIRARGDSPRIGYARMAQGLA